MLQALLKNKLKDSFSDPHFKPSEDSKTSCVFGLLQYLPSEMMWKLLRISCGSKDLPGDSGELLNIEFWEQWSAKGNNDITNKERVEPDVFCRFENFDLIIEAKKNDDFEDHKKDQWKNEILAYFNENCDKSRQLEFIAFGGNKILQDQKIEIRGKEFVIHKASWQNLLLAIVNISFETQNKAEKRVLNDIITAFEKHNYFSIKWLETMIQKKITKNIKLWQPLRN